MKHFFEFGPFRLDASDRLLLRDGKIVPLKPKVIDTLLVLVENKGRVLVKEELLNALWPDSFVEEGNLTQNIYVLRKALGTSADDIPYIETIPKRGYRFAASVKELAGEGKRAVSEESAGRSGPAAENKEQDPAHKPAKADTAPAPVFTASRNEDRRLKRRVLYISALLFISSAAIVFAWRSSKTGRPALDNPVKSMAVLPFKSLGGNANEEFAGPGMADALVTKLSGVKNFSVLPTSTVLKYNGLDTDPLAVGRTLAVDSVLDGKMQRDGERIRVTVQLLRTTDGAPLWAGQFDENFTNVFAVQDSISDQVTRALTLRLSGEEREQLQKHYTENADAYQAYLKGRYFWNKRTTEGFKKAIGYFQQAIDQDPNYALAYAGLADCYMRLNERDLPPAADTVSRAKAAVMKALALDDSLAEAHATLGFIKFRFDWDFPGAAQEYERAIQLNPNYAMAHQWYAFYLLAVDRQPEALDQLNRARRLDPVSLNINSGVGSYFYFTRQYDQAIELLQKTVEMEPSFAEAHWTLGLAYEQKGLSKQAADEFKKVHDLSGDNAGPGAPLGHLYAVTGKTGEARRLIDELRDVSKRRFVSPYEVAVIYAGLGEKEQALEWLEKARDERSLRPVWLKFDPRLDDLRADSRFADLMRRVFHA
jgi:DNA-binding winged helix-turn-helix (wHTH) protein/TolB-like protein/Tfp pilus assembly protein PilF